jgi:hypothetical protein
MTTVPVPANESLDLTTLLAALSDLPMAWIDTSLAATGASSERERRLPASATMRLAIAMGVLRDRAIADVANDLRRVRTRPGDAPLRSNAISAAWARLGEAPAADLAARCGREWAHAAAAADRWRGLAIYGLDGSTLRVADTPENREHFGGQGAGPMRGTSGYPLARIVARMAQRSHLLAALAVDSYARSSELRLTPALLAQVADAALTILDRNFHSVRLLLGYARGGTDRHWLLRAATRPQRPLAFRQRQEIQEVPRRLTATN